MGQHHLVRWLKQHLITAATALYTFVAFLPFITEGAGQWSCVPIREALRAGELAGRQPISAVLTRGDGRSIGVCVAMIIRHKGDVAFDDGEVVLSVVGIIILALQGKAIQD